MLVTSCVTKTRYQGNGGKDKRKGFEAGDCHIRLKVSEEKEGDVGFRTEYGNPEKVETSSCSERTGS